MLYGFSPTYAILVLCYPIITSYAFPLSLELGSPFSIADRRGVSSSKVLDNPYVGRMAPFYGNPTETLNTTLGPEWPITCGERRGPLNTTDCIHIATEIENSPGATSLRVYKSQEAGDLQWEYGGCNVVVGALHLRATDVFKPILIARDIRRVVEKCDREAGMTTVGPRRYFVMLVGY